MNQKALQRIIDIIVLTANTEKIFHLGNIDSRHVATTIFKPLPFDWEQPSSLDLLILTTNKDRIDELQDTIEDRCRTILPVTAIMMPIEKFNSLVKMAHPFATRIIASQSIIYDAGNFHFAEPQTTEPNELLKQLEEESKLAYRNGRSFLWASELQQARNELRLATFSLHQATELYFISIFQAMTGFRMASHNLDKLYRYCRSFNVELITFFPSNCKQKKDLFKLLQSGYIDARYKLQFEVKASDLHLLTADVKTLQKIAKEMIIERNKKQKEPYNAS
jgi:uncharacterized protein